MAFTIVPRYTWNNDGPVTVLKKQLSVTFQVDTVVTSSDIVFAFDEAGIDVDDITSIQRKTSNKSWVVSFKTATIKEQALALPHITIAGCQVFLGDAENVTVLVKVYEAPDEMPDSVVIGRLSHYGKVLSFRRDKLSSGIFNGIRTARMRLKSHIPQSVFIAGETVYFSYPTQPRVCRRCGDENHFHVVRCFNCELPGHRIEDCTEPTICSICRESTHSTADCPFLLYSTNVTPVVPGNDSYANAVKSKPQRKAESGESKKAESKKSESKKGDSTKKSQHKPRETESDTTHVEPQSSRERERERDSSWGRSLPKRARGEEKDEERNHEKERDRERECERERDRERSRRDRERERSRERERDRDRYYNRYYRDHDYYYDDRHPYHRSSRDYDDDKGWTLVTNRKRSGRSRS